MLFAVEGGGFFSSSASGYSKGLTLLLLGRKSEEKPMRVTPWNSNHYQLVDQEPEPDLQLAPEKNQSLRGCGSFICSGRCGAAPDCPSPLKVGPALNKEVLLEPPIFDDTKDPKICADHVVDHDVSKTKIISLKSSLKKAADSAVVASPRSGHSIVGENNEHQRLREKNDDFARRMGRRKVHWTDTTGGELYEIREYEISEDGSDKEFDHTTEHACSCAIM